MLELMVWATKPAHLAIGVPLMAVAILVLYITLNKLGDALFEEYHDNEYHSEEDESDDSR